MKKILKVDNPNVYAEYVGAPLLHPQLALISYDEVSPLRSSMNNYGVYALFIQKQFPKYLSYGTKSIVVGDSSIIAVAPGRLAEVKTTALRYSSMGGPCSGQRNCSRAPLLKAKWKKCRRIRIPLRSGIYSQAISN